MLNTVDESEWRTRKDRIDTRLTQCNPPWQLLPWKPGLDLAPLRCHAVTEFPTSNGPADYALFVDGQLLAILEAKKVSVSPQNVLEQAKRYAQGAAQGPGNWNGLRVPSAEQIEAHFTKAQQQVDKLTPSLLAKAFRGELVPQDPNDEPASKLLERIHVTRSQRDE